MRVRIIAFVAIFALMVGVGWYVTTPDAQDSTLPTFNDGDVLFALDLNRIVQQVEANTSAISANANGSGGGELRLSATLSGAQEVTDPSGGVDTVATGEIEATFDPGLTQVAVRLRTFDIDNVTRAHFHCARAGANGPIALGLFDPGPCVFDEATGETECTLSNDDFQLADCITPIGRPVVNIASLFFAMRDGLIYANVHTSDFPGGEIRGQLLED